VSDIAVLFFIGGLPDYFFRAPGDEGQWEEPSIHVLIVEKTL
jgi:hypothetical protein